MFNDTRAFVHLRVGGQANARSQDVRCPAENIENFRPFHNDVIHPMTGCVAIGKNTVNFDAP